LLEFGEIGAPPLQTSWPVAQEGLTLMLQDSGELVGGTSRLRSAPGWPNLLLYAWTYRIRSRPGLSWINRPWSLLTSSDCGIIGQLYGSSVPARTHLAQREANSAPSATLRNDCIGDRNHQLGVLGLNGRPCIGACRHRPPYGTGDTARRYRSG
jgi:hypothetical protein